MKITVWGINYYPEKIGIGLYTTQMCEYMAEHGIEVRVVTGYPYYPFWSPFSKITHIYQQDRHNGILADRCWHFIPRKAGAINRIFHELSFVLCSFVRQLTLPRADLYIVVSPPLLLGAFAFVLCLLKRSKYVFHVQDLQPDAALALGMLRPGLFVIVVRALEKLAYAGAAHVFSISPEMCQLISQRCNPAKVMLFPNWIAQTPPLKDHFWRTSSGIGPQRKVVAYFGNLGRKQGLNLIIDLADCLRNEPDILFVIGGAGPLLDELHKESQRHNLTNILFQGLLEDDEHSSMLEEIDIFLIPQQPGSGNVVFPSKLLKVLAAGCPVISNCQLESGLARVLSENDCGVVIANGTPEELANAIIDILRNETRRETLKKNSQDYAGRFRQPDILKPFVDRLKAMVDLAVE